MKSINLLVSPNYAPERFIDWHLFNSIFQDRLRTPVNILMPDNDERFQEMNFKYHPDIIYSNPFDVGNLINQHNYISVAKPASHSDEIVFISSRYSNIRRFSDIKLNEKIAIMRNKELEIVSLRLLEAINLDHNMVQFIKMDYPQAILRKVNLLDIPVGVIFANLFNELEDDKKDKYNVLMESKMEFISHVFLMRRDNASLIARVQQALLDLYIELRYRPIFKNLGWERGIQLLTEEDGLFLIDIFEALQD